MAADTGGNIEATTTATDAFTAPPAPSSEPVATGETELSGDAAAVDESAPLLSDEEIGSAPDQWREKLSSLLTWGKGLETDLKALKGQSAQWEPLADYGEPDAIRTQLETLRGLGVYATDEHGRILTDPQTNFPYLTTQPFLDGVTKLHPGDGMLDQLAYDIWGRPRSDGQTYGQWYLQQLGLDPGKLEQYAAMDATPQAVGKPPEDELVGISDELHQTYEKLSLHERKVLQKALDEGLYDEVEASLRETQARHQKDAEAEQFRQEMQRQQQEQLKAETDKFWQTVENNFQEAISKSNQEVLSGLQKQISSQVTFSADPTANAVQSNAVTALLAAMVNPSTRFATAPILEALQVQFDPQIEQLVAGYERALQTYHTLREAANNPRFNQHRNDAQMAQAEREAAQIQQRVMAKLAPVALKVAKVLAGANQSLREADSAELAKVKSRPAIGNGAITNGGRQAPPSGVDPFTVEFLQQRYSPR
jgi:hypothetical protein